MSNQTDAEEIVSRFKRLADEAKDFQQLQEIPEKNPKVFGVKCKDFSGAESKLSVFSVIHNLPLLIPHFQNNQLRGIATYLVLNRKGITYTRDAHLEHEQSPEVEQEMNSVLSNTELVEQIKLLASPDIFARLSWIARHFEEYMEVSFWTLVRASDAAFQKYQAEARGENYDSAENFEKLVEHQMKALKNWLGIDPKGGRPHNRRDKKPRLNNIEVSKEEDEEKIVSAMCRILHDTNGDEHRLSRGAVCKQMGVSRSWYDRRKSVLDDFDSIKEKAFTLYRNNSD